MLNNRSTTLDGNALSEEGSDRRHVHEGFLSQRSSICDADCADARLERLDALVAAIGAADAETLVELRQLLLRGMFPAMPELLREVVMPLFALVTLETKAIEKALPRLGETCASSALIGTLVS